MVEQLDEFLKELALYDQKSVSEESGVEYSTLNKWLRHVHTPSLPCLVRVAPVIGMEVTITRHQVRVRAVG